MAFNTEKWHSGGFVENQPGKKVASSSHGSSPPTFVAKAMRFLHILSTGFHLEATWYRLRSLQHPPNQS
jgi:hypothetical protein